MEEQGFGESDFGASRRVSDPDAARNERTYAVWIHLTTIVTLLLGIPCIAPLIMWLVKRDTSPFVDDHGKEVVNFQITLLIYALISFALMPLCGIGAILLAALYVLALLGMIFGSVAASRAEFFRYPMTLRLVR